MLTTALIEAADPAVRFAMPSDEEDLVDMVRVMHEDAEWGALDLDGRPFPFSAEKTRATIQRATSQPANKKMHHS